MKKKSRNLFLGSARSKVISMLPNLTFEVGSAVAANIETSTKNLEKIKKSFLSSLVVENVTKICQVVFWLYSQKFINLINLHR
jgi:hypothetical protein